MLVGIALLSSWRDLDWFAGVFLIVLGLLPLAVFFYRDVLGRPTGVARERWAQSSAGGIVWTIDMSGVSYQSPTRWGRTLWAGIAEARDDGQILALVGPGSGFVAWLDMTAFASVEERATVVAFVGDRIADARRIRASAAAQPPATAVHGSSGN